MIVIYLTQWCSYCYAAKKLLVEKGCEFEEIDLGAQPDRRSEMVERGGRHTVPQIWVGDRHIGGYQDLSALNDSGELDKLLGVAAKTGDRTT